MSHLLLSLCFMVAAVCYLGTCHVKVDNSDVTSDDTNELEEQNDDDVDDDADERTEARESSSTGSEPDEPIFRDDTLNGDEDKTDNDEEDDEDENTAKVGYHQSMHHEQQPYSKPKEKTKIKKVFVPVYVPDKDKKKMKIISVEKGFYIPGGNQLQGKFKSLKHCMKACAISPTCFAGDYNPWLHKCYVHSNQTACNTQNTHPQFVHFSKVPCSVTDAPTGNVALGVSAQNGIEQKGIDSLQQCIKKCANAGGGIQATVAGATTGVGNVFDPAQFARNLIAAFGNQACFAIDYDFTTHKCFFFGNNVITTVTDGALNNGVFSIASINYFFLNCAAYQNPTGNAKTGTSLNAISNPTTVHITFCPKPVGNIG